MQAKHRAMNNINDYAESLFQVHDAFSLLLLLLLLLLFVFASICNYFTCLWLDHPFVCLVRFLSVGKCLESLELDRASKGLFI